MNKKMIVYILGKMRGVEVTSADPSVGFPDIS